ncbi:MAG TPA: hypothetical protein VF579_15010, partial [Candidatus Methylomirabilis sp.]
LVGGRNCARPRSPRSEMLPVNPTFFPQGILGLLGMPRRYHAYPREVQLLNVLSTTGSTVRALGYVLPLFSLTWSLVPGAGAGANSWGATGLEWQTPSPPPVNVDTAPVVTDAAYAYESLPEASRG